MLNSYNGLRQLQITKFIDDNDVTLQDTIIGKNNIYTSGESTEVYLPSSEFHNIFPGAIISANKQSRYLLTKSDSYDLPSTLSSSVNWFNSGVGYSFTYRNPISQILSKDNDIIGYLTDDNKIYLLITKDNNAIIHTDEISSTTNGLKLLNSSGYGIYITTEGTIYKGDSLTNVWETIGGITEEGLANLVRKTDTDVSGNNWVLDEDSMNSDSDTKLATQQSLKAFVDNKNVDGGEF